MYFGYSQYKQKGNTLIFLLIGILVLAVAGGAYYLGRQTTPKFSSTPVSTSQPAPQITSSPNIDSKDTGIVVKSNTVSFASVGDKIILRYKGKFFEESKTAFEDPTEIKLGNEDSYSWYGLVDAPSYLEEQIRQRNGAGYNEIFSFKIFPDKKRFVFVMRWDNYSPDPMKAGLELPVYLYDPSKDPDKSTKILSFKDPSDQKYNFPKIDQVSIDGKYISFNMFGCWNCGGHQPEKLLYQVDKGISKRIGKMIYFKWLESGNYEYKEYKEIECKESGPGACSEDESKLPLKTGRF